MIRFLKPLLLILKKGCHHLWGDLKNTGFAHKVKPDVRLLFHGGSDDYYTVIIYTKECQ